MARPKRYHYPGCFYHAMFRGNDGNEIFFSDRDRYDMCFLLQEGVQMYGHRIHAFCFMRNHIHLLIQIANTPLSKIMHNLGSRYSNKINRRYEKNGHLFQGRYKGILIQDGIYFSRLLRYIHRNPVRAGIVDCPENYHWSSHNVYMGRSRINWITKDFGLSKFGMSRGEALIEYAQFVSEVEPKEELEKLRADFKDGNVLGDDDFLNFVRNESSQQPNKLLSIETIMNVVCDEFRIEKNLILSKDRSHRVSFARAVICKLGVEEGNISISSLGNLLNRDQSTISRLIENLKNRHKVLASEYSAIESLKDLLFKIENT